MRNFVFAALVSFIPCLASAQTLDPKYDQVGALEAMIDGEKITMIATFNKERERSSATVDARSGFAMITTQVRSIDADGSLASPGVGILIGPLMSGATPNADVTVMGADGFYVSDVDIGGRLPVSDLDYEEPNLSFSVAGELVPVKRVDGVFQEDTDRAPISFSGVFMGTPDFKK